MGQSKLIPVFMAQVSFPSAGTWCKEMQEIKTINNSCLFCTANGAGVLSNEHVTPQWLLDHLDLPQDDLLFQGVASSNTEELIVTPRIHSTFNFVQGHVCQKCNNGWMSRLEAIAKPLLVPLIDDERKVEDLHPTEASIIGKGAAKNSVHGQLDFAFEAAG